MKTLLAAALLASAALHLPANSQNRGTGGAGLTNEQLQILEHMSIVYLDDGFGNPLKTIRFKGVNVQIVNGLRATNGNAEAPYETADNLTEVNGLGNLIVGYQETREKISQQAYSSTCSGPAYECAEGPCDRRTGSHNIVVGNEQNYESFGGVVFGSRNRITAPWASITGGYRNWATGEWAAVAGGIRNWAEGSQTAVVGGLSNTACGTGTAVLGGTSNKASGSHGAIAGGLQNTVSGSQAAVLGGFDNSASGDTSTVLGGNTVIIGSGQTHLSATGVLRIDP